MSVVALRSASDAVTLKRHAAVTWIGLVVALAVGAAITVGRLWGDEFLGRADLTAHLRLALSASRELAGGNWLLAYVNDAPVGFQPFFLYYTVGPPWIAGALKDAFGISAYQAVLATFAVFFVIAGVGVALVCRYLRMAPLPSAVAEE